jgi:hypothetical protein
MFLVVDVSVLAPHFSRLSTTSEIWCRGGSKYADRTGGVRIRLGSIRDAKLGLFSLRDSLTRLSDPATVHPFVPRCLYGPLISLVVQGRASSRKLYGSIQCSSCSGDANVVGCDGAFAFVRWRSCLTITRGELL